MAKDKAGFGWNGITVRKNNDVKKIPPTIYYWTNLQT